MARPRTPKAIRRFDHSKFIVLLALLFLLIILFSIYGYQSFSDTSSTLSTVVPTYTTDPAVIRPLIVSPFSSRPLIANEVTFTGTGAPNSRIQLVRDGEGIAIVTADEAGDWQAIIGVADSGTYEFGAQALDTANNVIAQARPLTLEIAVPTATATPIPTSTLTPTLTPTATPLPALAVDALVFDLLGQTGVVRMNGTGKAGVVAQLLANQTVVSTTTVDAVGLWSLITPLDNPTQYAIGLRALLTDGQAISITVPMNALALALPTPTPTLTPAPTNTLVPTPPPTAIAPTFGEVVYTRGVNTGTVTLTGMGEPGTLLHLLIDETLAATTTVDAAGSWAVVTDLVAPSDSPGDSPGDYMLTLQTIAADGSVVPASGPVKLIVPADPTATPTTEAVPTATATLVPTLAPPTSTETPIPATQTATRVPPSFIISQSTLTIGDTLELRGQGVPSETIELIVGGSVIDSSVVQADGTYTFTLSFTAPGIQYIGVRAVNAAGEQVVGRTFAYIVVNPPPTATATSTATPTVTPADTSSATPTATSSATSTFVPTVPATSTATATATAAATMAPTATATPPPTSTPIPTVTVTPTRPPTVTVTKTATLTPSATTTTTSTATKITTATATPVPSPTVTPTLTSVPLVIPTATATAMSLSLSLSTTALPVGESLVVTGQGAPGERLEMVVGDAVIDSTTVQVDGTYTFTLRFASPGFQSIRVRPLGNPAARNLLAYIVVNPAATATSSAVPPPTLTAPPPVTPTATVPPAATVTATVTQTATRTPTATSTPTPTATNTATDTVTATLEPTAPPTHTATNTPHATATQVPTATNTATPTPTSTNTAIPTPSMIATVTPSLTSTPTPTASPTGTATSTATRTETPQLTNTATASTTFTPTLLPTPTNTPRPTPTLTPTAVPSTCLIADPQQIVGQSVLITGRGAPGGAVEIIVGDRVLATRTVAEDGTFTYTMSFATPGIQYITCRTAGQQQPARMISYIFVRPQSTSTPTIESTPTLIPTAIPTPSYTATVTPAPTSTATATLRPTVPATPSVPSTALPTNTRIATATITAQPTATHTATSAPTATQTALPTVTNTATLLPTLAPTLGPTLTATPTNTPLAFQCALSATQIVVGDKVVITGQGEPNTDVALLVGTEVVESAATSEDGTFSFEVQFVGTGVQSIVCQALNAQGQPKHSHAAGYVLVLAPTATPAPTNTASPVPTHTSTATNTPEPTATASATNSPSPTSTPTDQPTVAPTATHTATITRTATPRPTQTPAPTDTATAQPTATQTMTTMPTATSTVPPTATQTTLSIATATKSAVSGLMIALIISPTHPLTVAPTDTPTLAATSILTETLPPARAADTRPDQLPVTGQTLGQLDRQSLLVLMGVFFCIVVAGVVDRNRR